MAHIEFGWQSKDGLQFFAQDWHPDGDARAAVALVHGLGEHSSRYEHVANYFNQHGLAVVAMDLRGHGRTGGKRGHGSYDMIMEDIDRLLLETAQRYPGIPIILYGHSLGGAMVLYYSLKRQPKIKGVICTSPGLIPAQDPGGKILLARIMSALAPSFQIENGLDVSGLSHDAVVAKAYQADPLVHGKISARLGLDLIEDGKWIIENAPEFSLPLLLLQGSADRLVNPIGAKQFAPKVKNNIRFKLYDGWYHELHNEVEKEIVLHDMVAWVDEQLARS
jgi:alpha-beta hydrolase superfamily lysophospholipase